MSQCWYIVHVDCTGGIPINLRATTVAKEQQMTTYFYNPKYAWNGNEFMIMSNPCYETHDNAVKHGLGDGLELMAIDTDIGFTNDTVRIATSEEEGVRMVTAWLHGVFIGCVAGPLYDEVVTDES